MVYIINSIIVINIQLLLLGLVEIVKQWDKLLYTRQLDTISVNTLTTKWLSYHNRSTSSLLSKTHNHNN